MRKNNQSLSLVLLLVGLLTVSTFGLPSAFADKPNVVVFLADDQGWGDLSLNGNTNLNTPAIDSLARDGASFDNFYVCPVCSPTRAEFLTGLYHARLNVTSTSAGGERMDLGVPTIADILKAQGYRTAAFGKWHSGMQYPYHPCGRGFDLFYGFCSGHWGNYFSPLLERNGELVQGRGFCVDDFTNQAIEFMHDCVAKDEPFFAYLPYNTPHSPMQVPTEFWSEFKNKDLKMRNRDPQREDVEHTRAALAMVENIDMNVGNVLGKLDEWGVASNTIVLYFTDNGPNGFRWNGGMKGRKGATDEGGVRSPLLVRWPSKIAPGKKIETIAGAIDLLPTLAELTGARLSSAKLQTQELDGTSLAPLLTQDLTNVTWPQRAIVNSWRKKVSVRNQRFRLDNGGKLFDIDSDRGQKTDVTARFPEVHKELTAIASAFRTDVLSKQSAVDQRPFTLGSEKFRHTQIPARDAVFTGGIIRSNKFPNCSFSPTGKMKNKRSLGLSKC